jgi:hypothetical protein
VGKRSAPPPHGSKATPKVFASLSPGQRPGTRDHSHALTPKVLAKGFSLGIANTFSVDLWMVLVVPGRCPGLRLANTFGVAFRTLIRGRASLAHLPDLQIVPLESVPGRCPLRLANTFGVAFRTFMRGRAALAHLPNLQIVLLESLPGRCPGLRLANTFGVAFRTLMRGALRLPTFPTCKFAFPTSSDRFV